jgi:hypothetical protein
MDGEPETDHDSAKKLKNPFCAPETQLPKGSFANFASKWTR